MTVKLWRDTTIRVLEDKIGNQARSIVDQALKDCGVPEDEITAVHFVDMVRKLYDMLPPEVDRRALCRSVTASILAAYGFPSGKRE